MEAILGEIKVFAGTFAPAGWLLCDGSTLPISQYEALFSLIGTTYGGDGQTTFDLPDLRGRIIINQGQGPGLMPHVMGQTGGSESVTLTQLNMPAHSHSFMVSTAQADQTATANNFLAAPFDANPPSGNQPKAVVFYLPNNPSDPGQIMQPLLPATIGPAGGNQPHENRMPFLPINYIICTEGIYPSFQ